MNTLCSRCSLAGVEVAEFAGGRAAYYCAARPGKRAAENEDALLLFAEGETGILAVADGAGGQPEGARAAETALTELRESFAGHAESAREAVLSGFDRANQAVAGFGVGAATTLAVALVRGGHVRAFHAGDSFLLLVGQRGRRKLETISHSPVGYAMEAGVLGEDEALVHEDLHVVSNMIGMPGMHVEMSARLPMAARDTLLVATDGVRDNLRVDEIADLIRTGPPAQAADRLARRVAERMGGIETSDPSKPDDAAFVIFRR